MEKCQTWSELSEGDLCNHTATIRGEVTAPGNGSEDTHIHNGGEDALNHGVTLTAE